MIIGAGLTIAGALGASAGLLLVLSGSRMQGAALILSGLVAIAAGLRWS